MRRNRVVDRRLRAQIRDDGGHVLVGEALHFHERQERTPIVPDPASERTRDRAIAHSADPGLGIGRDVGHVESARRNVEHEATREGHLGAGLGGLDLSRSTVTIRAGPHAMHDVPTARNHGGVARRRDVGVGGVELQVLARGDEDGDRCQRERHDDDQPEHDAANHGAPSHALPGGARIRET